MDRVVDQAIETLRALPPDRADEVATLMLDLMRDLDTTTPLDAGIGESHVAAINEGVAALKRGEIVDDADIQRWIETLDPRRATPGR